MKTKIIGVFLLLSQFSFSQDIPSNAPYLFAGTAITGTARGVGTGGAYGSVGADMSCIDINPAGLGLYRSTDFCITPMVQFGSNESVYDGNHTVTHHPAFYLAQGGFVYTKVFKKPGDNAPISFSDHPLRTFSFGLNFQQQAFFNRSQIYGATNTTQSLMDTYAAILNNLGPGNYPPTEVQVIQQLTGLLGQNTANGAYYSNVVASAKTPVQQSGDIEERGGINRIDAAFGFNLLDKLYLGFDLAVPILGYSLSTSLTETPTVAQTNQIEDYTMNPVTTETGFGFNGIIGAIYRPMPWMRIGAAYHLPTWYVVHEDYQFNFNEDTASLNYNTQGQPITLPTFNYGLRTPMKGDFSASFYYKELGFISADYDIQNMGATRIHVPQDTFQVESGYNQQFAGTYKFVHTVHAGLEVAPVKVLRLRAGYAFSTSPYKSGQQYIPVTGGYNDVKNAFTLGIGVRLKHFYADFAYVYAWSKDASVQLSNFNYPVNSMYNTSTLLLTVGWKFDAGGGDKTKSNNQQNTQQRRYSPPPVDSDQRY